MRIEFYTDNGPYDDIINLDTLTWDIKENGFSLLGQDTSSVRLHRGFYIAPSKPLPDLPMTKKTALKWLRSCGLLPATLIPPAFFGLVTSPTKMLRFAESRPELFAPHVDVLRSFTSAPLDPTLMSYIDAQVVLRREERKKQQEESGEVKPLFTAEPITEDAEEVRIIPIEELDKVLTIVPRDTPLASSGTIELVAPGAPS